MSGVGGYVRRQDRGHFPIRPRWAFPRDGGLTFSIPRAGQQPLEPFAVLPEAGPAVGMMLANMLGAEPDTPGPPYIHRFSEPEQVDESEDRW